MIKLHFRFGSDADGYREVVKFDHWLRENIGDVVVGFWPTDGAIAFICSFFHYVDDPERIIVQFGEKGPIYRQFGKSPAYFTGSPWEMK